MSAEAEDEQLVKLANTLRSCGAALNYSDAVKRARQMLGKDKEQLPTIDELEAMPPKSAAPKEQPKQQPAEQQEDESSLMELMQEDADKIYKQALLGEDEKDSEFVKKDMDDNVSS